MSHYITVPINENGVINDENIASEIGIGCARRFGTTDVFLYSHGWWTSAIRAMAQYNRFSIEFADKGIEIASLTPPALTRLPAKALGVGLHWPSMLSEDQGSALNFLEATSFYTMEKRADTIGEHALYSILRMVIQANQEAATPLRFHLLGHSFGCKVVCSALQAVATDEIKGSITKALDINVVLLQAAFENDAMDAGGIYESVPSEKLNVRMLVSRSDLDIALKDQFNRAKTVNLFAKNKDRIAMGYQGPTAATRALFKGCRDLTVNPGFKHSDFGSSDGRLFCANLTPVHQKREADGIYKGDSFGGHHSDINAPEIYELLAAFLFT